MQKGFAPLVVLMVILVSILAGGAVYFLFYSSKSSSVENTVDKVTTPVEDSTSSAILKEDPNIYTDNEGNFSLTTDPRLEAVEETEDQFEKRVNGNMRKNFTSYIQYAPAQFVNAFYLLGEDKNYDQAPLSVWVFENPAGLDPQGFYKKYWYYPFVWGDFTSAKNKIAPETEEIIDGKIGYSGVVNYRPANPKFIYLQYKEKMYLFRLVGDTDILKGFKFIN